MTEKKMHLKVLLPTEVLVDEVVSKVIAEARNGAFCLLPRHIDFVAALVPGILVFTTEDKRENYLAVDEGTLVKCGQEVLISVLNGARSTDLEDLKAIVEENFRHLDEYERLTRTALARLEAGVIRRFMELEE
ncbi:ATP synthase F1, epsilon subunit [Nitrosococcus halophilus Nc 4]|uniref:ATP synthase epsilon chain n=1 Tax=Nitrosococcus halophilus (strain Nc4) TaxID=472759 RepID=D5C3T6_NITHN|nr:F0F1 ATP synthase subunit epsilon [Nitrosococcus halophilus]ADE15058.1 ATP synthase F1, epsilon subunit [Nitrosococcus halophilus Nc 4]